MIFENISLLTGEKQTIELPMDEDLFYERYLLWREGELIISEAFPDLDDEQLEFILTGKIEGEFDKDDDFCGCGCD